MRTRTTLTTVLLSACLALAACASDSDSNNDGDQPSKSSKKAASSKGSSASDSAASTDSEHADKAGDAHAAGENPATGHSDVLPSVDVKTPLKDLPAECKGFEVAGLKASPGGSTLPNKCAPFHGTLNNPYAIRCIDADPSYKTNYRGDEFCILPPPEELGTQIHVGPEDYDQPGTFALGPGEEENTSYYVNAPNTGDHFYYRTNWRMRPGSHHMIITISDDDRPDGWAADLQGPSAKNSATAGFEVGPSVHSFGGSQRPDLDRPQGTLDTPPENVGIGAKLLAKQQFNFNLHHINTGTDPVLREAWVNVWYMDEKDVTKTMKSLAASGSPIDVSIPAHQRTVLKYKCDVQGDSRIITLNGHRHAHTDRFSVWVKKQSGETVSAYESFNWEDMPTYQYDSVSSNPTPDVPTETDGASSGTLEVQQGDEVHFLCDIDNTLDKPLRFANEAIDGEMCILFGSYVGAMSPCSGGAQRVTDDSDGVSL